MTHTKDMLAEALRELGLETMAAKAAKGFYHDFMSPLPFPELTLLQELLLAAKSRTDMAIEIMLLRDRVKAGDFDASDEEGDEWANSPEGQDAMRQLIKRD